MASRRDDMVIRPQVEKGRGSIPGNAKQGAMEAAAAGRVQQRAGVLRRAMQIRAARKVTGGLAAKKAAGKKKKGSLLKRAAASPIGLGITAGAIIAGIMAKSNSGLTFEAMGAHLNKWALGQRDDNARAAMEVRSQFISNRKIMSIAESQGTRDQLAKAFNILYPQEQTRQLGLSRIMEDEFMMVEGNLDIILGKIADALRSGPSSSEMKEAVEMLVRLIGRRSMSTLKMALEAIY